VPPQPPTCSRNRDSGPPKPIRCNIATTGPPLIWTAVGKPYPYSNDAFDLVIELRKVGNYKPA
jgi:hypothetical protein